MPRPDRAPDRLQGFDRLRRALTLRWQGLAWRTGHVARRATERAAQGLLALALRARLARRLPRRWLAALERRLIGAVDYPLFDPALYLDRNGDVRAAGVAPLRHYLAWGWAEGRDPNGWLDERRYRRQAGLAQADRVSALGHYLALGRARGLGPAAVLPGEVARCPAPKPRPDEDQARIGAALARLAALGPPRERLRSRMPEPEVDVIIPVYGGRAETLTCLASVLAAANRTRFAVVAVDDRGPDPRLRADLARLARRGLIELVVQPANRGFAATINAGTRRHPRRDVIWLNADTEVCDGWIDRLRRVAHGAPDIATVTPLTNNGTICSYPRFDTDNCEPLEIGWGALDRMAARVNAGRTVAAPTCVGFCTYVRRDALVSLGLLDEAAFGQGYGEENDFSQRAVAAGRRNLIAGEVFVYHAGQTSFGEARAGLVEAALRRVEQRHPGYRRAVRDFLADDPVAPLRRALDLARLRRRLVPPVGPRRNVLMVTHVRGGGTGQHVREEAARQAAAGAGVVLMSGGAGGAAGGGDSLRLTHPALGPLPALADLGFGGRGFVELVRGLGITELQLHHLADFGRDAARRFAWLIDALDLPFDFVVHDYLAICPRINLADGVGMYCGEPGEVGCRRCLLRRRSDFGAPDIRAWRRDYGALLAMARQVRVPDRDVAARLGRYFPQLGNIVMCPHEAPARPVPARGVRRQGRRAGSLRIATVGAIGPIKGFDVLLALAGEIRARGAAAALTVVGYTRNDAAARAAGITVTGPYDNAHAAAEIAAAEPDLILIPSTWPETFCYTLSHALASGRPVAGFDIGAVGTRLRDSGRGTVLPLALARDPAALLGTLMVLADQGAPGAEAPVAQLAAG